MFSLVPFLITDSIFLLFCDCIVSLTASFVGFCKRIFERFGDLLSRGYGIFLESNHSFSLSPYKICQGEKSGGDWTAIIRMLAGMASSIWWCFPWKLELINCINFGWILWAIFGGFKNLKGLTFINVNGLVLNLLKKQNMSPLLNFS